MLPKQNNPTPRTFSFTQHDVHAAECHGTANATQSITVEISALVPTVGAGSAWTVGINNGDGNDTYAIGDLERVGTDWTTVEITVPLTPDGDTGSLANYLDANGEMLISLTSATPGTTQVGSGSATFVVVLLRYLFAGRC